MTARRALSLRAMLVWLFVAILSSVLIAMIALAWRVGPTTAAIAAQGNAARADFSERAQLATQLDSAITDLWSQLRRARRAPLPADSLAIRRQRVERIAHSTGLLDPLRRNIGISAQVSSNLERADEATRVVTGALLGVISALELRDTAAAAALLSRADSLDTPVNTTLTDLTTSALANLAADEARLARDARFATWLLVAVLAAAVLTAPFLWALLNRRLLRPLHQFDAALHRIDAGELDVELPVPIDDELGRLGQHFNRTTQVLREQRSAAEHAAAQAAHDASEARYRTVFDEAAVGLTELTLEGVYIRVNRAMCTMLARDAREIVGRHFLTVAHVADQERDAVRWNILVRGEVNVTRLERRYVRSDGVLVTAQVTATILRNEDGTPRHVLAVVQDVTEQRRLEREVLQSTKLEAVGQLAGGVAHDFNNLLAGIMGYAELLETDPTLSTAVRDDAAAIRRAAMRGADLSRSLLTLARRTPLKREPFSLDALAQETADIARRTIDRRIAVTVQAAPGIAVVGDRSLLSNALLNLVLNARDAMPDGGSITMTIERWVPDAAFCIRHALEANVPYATIQVVDTGHGMSSETLARAFEPFFTTKELGKGTGLGLALVYGTVKEHLGAVTVESEVGHGTTVTVTLPCTAHVVRDEVTAPTPRAALATARILVVDDEPIVQDAVTRMLERLGYVVVCANDGADALAYFDNANHDISLVLLDGNMPRMSGLETARVLRARHPEVPILFASGYLTPQDEAALVELGLGERLTKPYAFAALAGRVAETIGDSATRRPHPVPDTP
ncbi:MAG: response regulator [Gemmatimonadaceae bacterium]|nr:response regulator [Gemmatimonadaceae bacterium]